MRYNKIRKMDISNGPGVRVSIFMQGCTFNCKNCFNQETHDFNGGKDFNDEVIAKVLKCCEKEYIVGLSILGGEPMHPRNVDGTLKLAKSFKESFPNKTLWVWTGFLFDDLKNKYDLKDIDVIVDGQFKDALKNYLLKYCGSENQRIIDVRKSLELNKVILYEDNDFDQKKEGKMICA